MNNDKSDYRKGLLYFCILMACIFSWFTTPDGDTIFYKLIGLLGISPGIPIGGNATIYVYMFIPLIATVVSIKKILKYWQGYGLRFREYNPLLRFLPAVISIPVFMLSGIMSPSLLDRMYYAVISQREGLQAVTHYVTNDQIGYEFKGSNRTYSYDLALGNHSSEALSLNAKLVYKDMDGTQEVFIKEDNGELKVFSLPPEQLSYFMGEFTDYHQTTHESGSGKGIFSIVLVNGDEQYTPESLVRRPVF